MTAKPADDVEVEIVDEKPPAETAQPKPDGPTVVAKPVDADMDAALEKLKRELASEKAATAEANRRAAAAEGSAVQAQTAAQQSDLQMVTGAVDAVKLTEENLKRAYAEAASNGDWDSAANAQAEMAKNAAKLLRLEEGKAQLEKAPKPQAPQPRVDDRVESVAAQLSPKSAQWVRAHPEFVRDNTLNRRLLAAHNLAETDGHALDSDEYFAAVERTLGIRIPGDKPLTTVAADPAESPLSEASSVAVKVAPAAAPVSRGNGNKRVVRLTPAQVEAAELSGMTTAEYAMQLENIDREKAARLN